MNTNPEVEVQWLRLSPLAVIFFILKFAQKVALQALPALVIVFAGLATADPVQRGWVIRGIVLLAVIIIGFSTLSYLRFRYRITDDRILLHRGVLHRDELDIEFHRVQNITIQEPFYMRPLGLSVLSIETAGSQAEEISIAGIQRNLALSLRDTILAGESSRTPELPGREVDNGEARLLVELSRRDVMIYGLTANFLLWAAIAIGALLSSDEIAKQLFNWLENRLGVEDILLYLEHEGGTLLVVLVVLSVLLLVFMLLPLISIIGALFRYDGYRLSVDGETYRKSSGLLTRFEDSLKRHKIQALVWKQNAIALYFKRISIQLRQASAGGGEQNGAMPAGTKSSFLVPSLHPAVATEISAEFFPECRPDQAVYSPIDRRRFLIFNMAVFILPFTLAILVPALLVSWKFFLAIPMFTGILFMVVDRRWQKMGWGVAGGYGFVRSGFIGTMITIFPLFKIQRTDIRQTQIQHRKGLAHLTIHLASHSVKVPYINIEDAIRFRDLALYSAESSTTSWY